MIRIFLSNITLIITDDCPDDMAACAIKTLCNRGIPDQVECEYDDEIKSYIPRYSKFIGQLGAQSR
jgi:hypothetical protein